MLRITVLAALSLALLDLSDVPTTAVAQVKQEGLIAFQRRVEPGPTEIHLMKTDGSNARKLARGCCVEWSPDGERVAYIGEGGTVYLTATDGTGQRQLGVSRASILEWSPNGQKIAFAGYGQRGIFVVNTDGTGTTRLTDGRDDYPRWSPNGRRIVFQRFLLEPNNNGDDIFVMNADGSNQQRLTRGSGHGFPTWSPGGHRIAFQGWAGDSAEIFVMNADGSDQLQLTTTPASDEYEPEWSPSGRKLLFLRHQDNWGPNFRALHVINRDGTRHRNLTPGQRTHSEPEWSKDGRTIIFVRERRRPNPRNGYSDIYAMTASGRDLAKLTNAAVGTHNSGPKWSP